MIRDIEKLCQVVGCVLSEEQFAQKKIEEILLYLREWNVIEDFDEDRLDWIFSEEQTY